MGLFDKLDKHAGLVGEMSNRVGVDWEVVLGERPEMAVQYRAAVLKCTQCRDVGACQGWLSGHERAAHAPGYCENADLFEVLKAG
jgi:hypothetical protein